MLTFHVVVSFLIKYLLLGVLILIILLYDSEVRELQENRENKAIEYKNAVFGSRFADAKIIEFESRRLTEEIREKCSVLKVLRLSLVILIVSPFL